MTFEYKNSYNVQDLVDIMALLRAPGGCPWDAEQTHESIKKNLIEETYEVIEAINKKDSSLLCEELGDLLMQVVFHAQMESECGTFDFDKVADGICKKLIVRHPHIFGDVTVNSVDDVLNNWDAIKNQTKGRKTASDSISSIPRELPALMRASKVQKKAADVGFDWPDISGALDKLDEEIAELRAALASGDKKSSEEELGDLIFSCVNVSRFMHCDAEEILTGATDKFASRFRETERLAEEAGADMKAMSIDRLDELWDKAKQNQ